MITLNFQPFLELFISSVAEVNSSVQPASLRHPFSFMLKNLSFLEALRADSLFTFFYFSQKKKEMEIIFQIFSALSKRDAHFFTNISEEQKKFLNTTFKQTHENKTFFVTHFLLEAIRASFLPAVETISTEYKKFNFSYSFNSLDPLSLALITYASLEQGHPLKSFAKKIIQVTADQVYSEIHAPYFATSFPPITWAILLSLTEEVKFLHEEKGMELTAQISFLEGEYEWNIGSLDYTKRNGFIDLNGYLQEKMLEVCQKTFYH